MTADQSSRSGRAATPAQPATGQALALATILQLQKEARQAASPAEFRFVVANGTRRLFPYQQAVLWERGSTGSVNVLQVSGVGEISRDAPFVRWLVSLIDEITSSAAVKSSSVIDAGKVGASLAAEWQDWLPGQSLLILSMGPRERPFQRGLFFSRVDAWHASEITIINELAEYYAYVWSALDAQKPARHGLLQVSVAWKNKWLYAAVAVLAVLMLPVHISVLAPAEIIPVNPIFITSPMDGVIKDFQVQPNQVVRAGQPLFTLDDTALRNQYEIAVKSLAVARADYERAVQLAFQDSSSKANLELLSAKVGLRQVELEYTQNLLNKIKVTAQQDGIVMFAEANDWIGKPVSVGEKIVTNARVEQTQVQIWVPVDDAISLAPGARVALFLNIDPTHPFEAVIAETSYEPKLASNGLMAFPVKARFGSADKMPRLGSKGTAKIYGEKVSLAYYLFRRPWSTLRRLTGL